MLLNKETKLKPNSLALVSNQSGRENSEFKPAIFQLTSCHILPMVKGLSNLQTMSAKKAKCIHTHTHTHTQMYIYIYIYIYIYTHILLKENSNKLYILTVSNFENGYKERETSLDN